MREGRITGATVAVLAALVALPALAPAKGPSGKPITSCSTSALQNAFAAGGSWVLNCSGTVAVPGAPFVVHNAVTIVAGKGKKVSIDGLGRFRVIEVDGGGKLTLTGVTITHGKATGADGGDALAGGPGTAGDPGSPGVDGPSGTPGAPGDDGSNGTSGGLAGGGAGAVAGGMLVAAGGSATLTNVNFVANMAMAGNGGDGGEGGEGATGGDGGRGGAATSTSGSGGDGGSGGTGGTGGQGGNGGNGGSAFGGAIVNSGTLSITGGNFAANKAMAGNGGKGGSGGDGGEGGSAGDGGDDQGQAVDGSGGPGGQGGSGGGAGPGGSGGLAEGGAIYNTGTLSMDGAKFKSDGVTGGKGANAGKLGKGGTGGTGGTGADGNNPHGDDDQDAGGLGGVGGDGGEGGGLLGGSDTPGPGGGAIGGAIFTTQSFTPFNVTFGSDTVKGGQPGIGSPQAIGGKGGRGGGGNGGRAAKGSDGAKSPVLPGVAGAGASQNQNISPSTITVISLKKPPPKSQGCIVPPVTGRTLAAAKTAITKFHCKLGKVSSQKSATVAKGHVVSGTPKAGTKRAQGAAVNLTVSTGKGTTLTKQCKVPKVAGDTLAAARSELKLDRCASGPVTHIHSAKIATGSVIATQPKAGTTHKAGTKVALIVSSGKKKK